MVLIIILADAVPRTRAKASAVSPFFAGGLHLRGCLDKNVRMSGRGRCLREHNKGGDNRGTELTFGEQLPGELGDTGNL